MTTLTVKSIPEKLLKLKAALEEGKRDVVSLNDQKNQRAQHRDQKSGSKEHQKNNQTSEQVTSNITTRTKDDGTKTSVIKKEIKQQRPVPYAQNERIMNALNWLYVTFPKLFKKQEKVPLKVGILTDIFVWIDAHKESVGEVERAEIPTKTAIRDAITFYTTNLMYQKALAEQDKRYDLAGAPIDEVNELHKIHATERQMKIEEIIKIKNEKRSVYHAKRKDRDAERAQKIATQDVPLMENMSIQHEDKT